MRAIQNIVACSKAMTAHGDFMAVVGELLLGAKARPRVNITNVCVIAFMLPVITSFIMYETYSLKK